MKVADWYAAGVRRAPPKVSIGTITYCHEAFIADAIESVLMQDVDFPVEMVIGEDCSPDGTRKIILDYVEKYPGFIRVSDYPENQGAAVNFRTTIGRCRGDYVALLDGDDYWTSPDKLRRQAGFLDDHPDVSMCFHAVNRMCGGRVVKSIVRPAGRRRIYHLCDLSQWINIATSATMYRRGALPQLPTWFANINQGDWALQVLLAERGNIAYIPELMATHRVHSGSFWSGKALPKSALLLMQLEDIEQFAAHLGAERGKQFGHSWVRRRYELVHAFLDEGRAAEARQVLRENCTGHGYDPRVDLLEPWLSFLHLEAPRLYRSLRLDAVYLNGLLHRSWGRLVRPILGRAPSMARALQTKDRRAPEDHHTGTHMP